jgi:hypothetical protein
VVPARSAPFEIETLDLAAPLADEVLVRRGQRHVPHRSACSRWLFPDFTRLIRAGETLGWAEATAEPVFLTRLLDAQAARCAPFRVFFPLTFSNTLGAGHPNASKRGEAAWLGRLAYKNGVRQSAAPRSTRAMRAADPSGSTIVIANLAICRLRSLASTSNSRPNNIASRYARSLTDDRFHSAAKNM